MLSYESLAIFTASAITFTLVYLKVPVDILQKIIVLLIVVLLIVFGRPVISKTRPSVIKILRLVLLLLSALITQLTVISSGGLFGPLLILLHLYTLGISFLLNVRASIYFLVFSVAILIANIYLNKNLKSIFTDDPFSVILYLVSFAVIIPLAQYLNKTYRVKENISQLLSEQLQMGLSREESILKGLNELIIITDDNLNILSINEIAQKRLNLTPEQILHKQLLDTLSIKDKNGLPATTKSLSLQEVLSDKTTRIVNDLSLQIEVGAVPTKVSIQIRPVVNSKGRVSQFVFVIKDSQFDPSFYQSHNDLSQAEFKYQAMVDDLRKSLDQEKKPGIILKTVLLTEIEQDLLLSREIEDHPIKQNPTFPDAASICKSAVDSRKDLADSLDVPLEFDLPKEEVAELALIGFNDSQDVPKEALPVSEFAVPIDPKWLGILIQKLIDICVLLSSSQKDRQVRVSIEHLGEDTILISISAVYSKLSNAQLKDLLIQYYGFMRGTNLRFGSGLEGFIAKNIAAQLNIPLDVNYLFPSNLKFTLSLSKYNIESKNPDLV